jgi:ribose 5-phosphate isomerase A
MPTTKEQDAEKQAAARAGLKFVQQGQTVGLGSGSTAAYFVRFLAERVRAGLKVCGIPTSIQTQQLAASLGIPLTTLDDCQQIDVAIDGADEVDPHLQLIKGGGGAFLREKIIASAAKRFVIIADSSKRVTILGKFAVPVEVVPFAQKLVAKEVEALGASVQLRTQAAGQTYVTDEGHHILDCHFGPIPDPAKLALQLESIPGVVEHGLFVNMADVVLIATGEEVTEMRSPA